MKEINSINPQLINVQTLEEFDRLDNESFFTSGIEVHQSLFYLEQVFGVSLYTREKLNGYTRLKKLKSVKDLKG